MPRGFGVPSGRCGVADTGRNKGEWHGVSFSLQSYYESTMMEFSEPTHTFPSVDFPTASEHWTLRDSTERAFRHLTMAGAAAIVAIVVGILGVLTVYAWPSLTRFGMAFLTSADWNPSAGEFGALSSIYGTLVSTLIALILAVPLSLAIAIFVVELAPPRLGRALGVAIELLASVPGIIFGLWGFMVLGPLMANGIQPFLARWLGFLPWFQGPHYGVGFLSAGVVLAIMMLPFMTAIMRDAFRMVPAIMKEASYGLGATAWEVTRDITLGSSAQGVFGACLLGLGRALGETIAVAFVIGNSSAMSASLFAEGNSLSSRILNEFPEAADPLYMSALLHLGLVLFALTFLFQALAYAWLRRVNRQRQEHRDSLYDAAMLPY